MKTVACVIQDGFAPFEFGVACEAFGLDRSDDGVPNFDFRIDAPVAGVVNSKIGFSVNVEHDLSFAYEADLVVFCPVPRSHWAQIDPLLLDVARHAVDRGAWVMSVCSGSFILAAAGVLDGRRRAGADRSATSASGERGRTRRGPPRRRRRGRARR